MSATRVSLIKWSRDPGDDLDIYETLLFDDPYVPWDRVRLDGTPREADWVVQPVYVENPLRTRPDIWHVTGAGGLAMNEEVLDRLEPYVSVAGELLPLRATGTDEEFFLLNILRVIDAIDPASMTDDVLELFPILLEHRLGETGLFKIPQLTSPIFYLEHDYDEDSFRLRVDRHGLTGIDFMTVWTSEDGPTVWMSEEGPTPINLIFW